MKEIHFVRAATNQIENNFTIFVNVRDHSLVFEIEPYATRQVVRFMPDGFSITEGNVVEIISEIIPESGTLREISQSSQTFSFARQVTGAFGGTLKSHQVKKLPNTNILTGNDTYEKIT